MTISPYGLIVETTWRRIPLFFPHVDIDTFSILPNHIHGILWLRGSVVSEAGCRTDLGRDGVFTSKKAQSGTAKGSLGAVMQCLKSISARKINIVRNTPRARVWQRNYYEHIVRSEEELERIREYIENNPRKWLLDKYHINP